MRTRGVLLEDNFNGDFVLGFLWFTAVLGALNFRTFRLLLGTLIARLFLVSLTALGTGHRRICTSSLRRPALSFRVYRATRVGSGGRRATDRRVPLHESHPITLRQRSLRIGPRRVRCSSSSRLGRRCYGGSSGSVIDRSGCCCGGVATLEIASTLCECAENHRINGKNGIDDTLEE